ncbi:MAG: Clp protease N-terminal domain-containing protein [Acidimicrobiales bacterium]
MYPFERFTERAKKVLTLAQEEAVKSHHSYIDTEHLLVGLLRDSDGLAARALSDLGVEIEVVRTAIAKILGVPERIVVQQIIPTSRVKKVIEIAFEEAQRMNCTYVGTEHLLLGLLLDGEGVAAAVLQGLDVDVEKVRDHLPHHVDEDSLGEQSLWVAPRSGEFGYLGDRPSESFLQRGRGFGALSSLTNEAASALALAEEEAVKASVGYFGTEHLLVGLVRQAEGIAAQVLLALGVDLPRVRQEVARNPHRSPRLVVQTVLPTSGLRAVTVLAQREAQKDPAERVDTQHLLLGITALDQEPGAHILAALGVDVAAIHEQLEGFEGSSSP